MPRSDNEKRNRLISAADELIYENGFNTTTLADIAKKAEVPLGNVYYYFKTKDSILEAVIDRRSKQFKELFGDIEQANTDATSRLQAFVRHHIQQSDTTARFGCSLGSLCQELGKKGGTIANSASKLMAEIIKWLDKQFSANGKTNSTALAEQLLIGIQGLSILTLTFKDPEILNKQGEELIAWVKAA